MAPVNESVKRSTAATDEIVITGISGRFPESSNMAEFAKNLFNGIDMVTDSPQRWNKDLFDVPHRLGKFKDIDMASFDQQFFGIHQKAAEFMDPQIRMLLESTYEAIVDAGVNPQDIRGSRTGVYIGVMASEIGAYWESPENEDGGYGLTGTTQTMFANRVSFAFDFKGPSFALDTACSSAIYAMKYAFEDIRSGKCDAAILGGVNLSMNPYKLVQFKEMGMLSEEGMCKAFEDTGAGYVRSDACVVIYMQKAVDSRRVYASILNIGINSDGYKERGITFPSGEMQNRLIRETFDEIGLKPNDVAYVEAHGTGTKAGDPQEVNSITEFFCKNRPEPLKLGSVKSNTGHTESAAALCSIAKILIAMETGIIPGNIHYKTPKPELYGILDGRLQVVDKNTPLQGEIVAMNSFGFGGSNGHLILKSNPKEKVRTDVLADMPRLIVASGRTREAVQLLLDEAEKHKDDEDFLGLLNEIHSKNIPLHYYRGHTLVKNQTEPISREVSDLTDIRPIWYVYSGMGSQWTGMACDLMHLNVFRQSIEKCATALQTQGIDLIEIITTKDEKIFDNILNSFVSIAAIQVALTDLLSDLNISPDGMVGHSVGELACAYADGSLTAEQTVLAAYWRGRCILEANTDAGAMAAIGLSWEECKRRLPADVTAACHNSAENVTISGSTNSVQKLVETFTSEGIFARAVNSCGIAFHSRYIADAAPKLLASLEQLIPTPLKRTSRWISSSVPECKWTDPIAQQSSAAYHVNNLVSPVLFHEALQHVPKNAICIEIAPTGLLQAILKRSLGQDEVSHISLMKRGHENNLKFMLSSVGKLYCAGGQPIISKLYRQIEFPVSRGTPMIGSLVRWDHSQTFMVPKLEALYNSGETTIDVNLSRDEDAYLVGHKVDGQNLYPVSGYLSLIWRTFAKTLSSRYEKTPVILENVVFHRPTPLPKEGSIKIALNVFQGTGLFEICESGQLTVSGKISTSDNIEKLEVSFCPLVTDKSAILLNSADVYNELRTRGYEHSGKFSGIISSDSKATSGRLQWHDNWVTYIDTMLQFSILGQEQRALYVPRCIDRLIINPMTHYKCIEQSGSIPVNWYSDLNVIKSGGIEMSGLSVELFPRRLDSHSPPILEDFKFVPLHCEDDGTLSRFDAINVLVQLTMENSLPAQKIKVVDIVGNRKPDNCMFLDIYSVIENEPRLTSDVLIATTNSSTDCYVQSIADAVIKVERKDVKNGAVESGCHLVTGYNLLTASDTIENASAILQNMLGTILETGFILLEESNYDKEVADQLLAANNLLCVSTQEVSGKKYLLLRKRLDVSKRKNKIIMCTEKSFQWVNELRDAFATIEQDPCHVYLVCQGEELFGSVGLYKCVCLETAGKFVRFVHIYDQNVEKFSLTGRLYKELLSADIGYSAFRYGTWGSFRHSKLKFKLTDATVTTEHAYLDEASKGDVTTLKWIQGPLSKQMIHNANEELCSVYYAPVNYRDYLIAYGTTSMDKLPAHLNNQDGILGQEFSGRNSNGKRVMGLVEARALATTCLARSSVLWPIPDNWTMEEASTVPLAYTIAFYSLMVRGHISNGESILIHNGSGAVGQAAIYLALAHGLRVYTTEDTEEKRCFVRKTYPHVKAQHVLDSTAYEQDVLRLTNGEGVNVILGSHQYDRSHVADASMNCLARNGRYLQLGNCAATNINVTAALSKNATLHGVLLDSIFYRDSDTFKEIYSMIDAGLKTGIVQPLSRNIYDETQIQEAFRAVASDKCTGKVVLQLRAEGSESNSVDGSVKLVKAVPRTYMLPTKSYIIIGGLGDLGLAVANWFVARGARKLVLTSRSGVRNGHQAMMIKQWTDLGVSVLVDTNDATTMKGATLLLSAATDLGPVGGIFNLAGILADSLIENQSESKFRIACKPKVDGTKCLDAVSRQLCPQLDYFVCFSSIFSGRGKLSQSNYGLANATMDRICEARAAAGLPATSIQWGPVDHTRMVTQNIGEKRSVLLGALSQKIPSFMQTFDRFLNLTETVLSSFVPDDERNGDASQTTGGLTTFLASCLGLKDVKNISEQMALADMGMDSLIVTETRQLLEREYNVVLSLDEVRQLNFKQVKEFESNFAQQNSS